MTPHPDTFENNKHQSLHMTAPNLEASAQTEVAETALSLGTDHLSFSPPASVLVFLFDILLRPVLS